MAVEANGRLGSKLPPQETHSRRYVIGEHVARGVGHVHGLRAVAFHELRLLQELLGGDHVSHHQEAHGVDTELA